MNILVIGNGFDLAHGLPTTYGDFLDWANEVYYKHRTIKKGITRVGIVGACTHGIFSEDLFYDIMEVFNKNIWIEYFMQKQKEIGDNWIDF